MSKNNRKDIKETEEQNIEITKEETRHKTTRTFERKYYEFSPAVRTCILTRRRHLNKKNMIGK